MRRLIQAFCYSNPDNYPPIINSARLLAADGWGVEIYCRDDGKSWDVSYPTGVRVERIQPHGTHSWRNYSSFVWTALRQGRRDASVYVGHDMHGLLPARMLATRYKRPLVYHCHDFAESRAGALLGGRMVRGFEQRFARTADVVIVPDADRAEVITRELQLKSPPMVVANAPIMREVVKDNSLVKRLASLNRNFQKIVFRQGRIGAGHGIEATLRSVVFWKNSGWGFVVMGLCDNGYADHLRATAQAIGVERQFVMLPPVSYDSVVNFTKDADVGHALYEPMDINNVHNSTASNKIMEYMEAGVPLLVSDNKALRALIEKYKCGLAADEQHPESIGVAINALLGDSTRAKRMGEAGRAAFENEFCYERQFAPVIERLDSLVRTTEKLATSRLETAG